MKRALIDLGDVPIPLPAFTGFGDLDIFATNEYHKTQRAAYVANMFFGAEAFKVQERRVKWMVLI